MHLSKMTFTEAISFQKGRLSWYTPFHGGSNDRATFGQSIDIPENFPIQTDLILNDISRKIVFLIPMNEGITHLAGVVVNVLDSLWRNKVFSCLSQGLHGLLTSQMHWMKR